jgi:hypothetical protein
VIIHALLYGNSTSTSGRALNNVIKRQHLPMKNSEIPEWFYSTPATTVGSTTLSSSRIRLCDTVVPPRYLIENTNIAIDNEYYINHMVIPPLQVLFHYFCCIFLESSEYFLC